jgi:hypothetical protein|nr:MAG: hypothetical protein [Bacteriophage sp.]UVM86565.1 MAG: hypothetical protein [Bacteriophage sp.]UVX58821.1 MAG: hypothetical protein [Bacteriophage sp.]
MHNFDRNESLIKQDLLNMLPEWWTQLNPDKHYLVLTNDCDSMFSCVRLKTLFGLEIGGYYDFESGLWLNQEKTCYGWKTPVFVDLSVGQNQLCFDNHRTFLKNHNRVNPNVIHKNRFNEKYNFGTITLIAALYGGVDRMNEELKTMLLAVDGGFIGYYKHGGRYSNINLYWLDKLGLTEYLVPILEKRDVKYFQDFSVDRGLYDKIEINKDGYLESPTYSDSVPDYQFELVQPVQKIFTTTSGVMQRVKNQEKIIVSAETYEGKYVINVAV